MTGAELVAARARLGLSAEQLAADLNLTPAVVEAWERGALRVPRDMAARIEWHAAIADRERIVTASGLAECAELAALQSSLLDTIRGGSSSSRIAAASAALGAHAEACALCRARAEYAALHAPPLPPAPTTGVQRLVRRITGLVDRLPRGLRPSTGERGEGRRVALLSAAALSTWALVLFVALTVGRIFAGTRPVWRPHDVLELPAIVAGYFVGFYLAGMAFDATRAIRRWLLGYVLRGALAASAIYGTIFAVMSVVDRDGGFGGLRGFAITIAWLGGAFGLVGAMLWALDRVRGRLPAPPD